MTQNKIIVQMGEGWEKALAPINRSLANILTSLKEDLRTGRQFLPSPEKIFAAFAIPFDDVKVVIVGQDPYPTPGHAMGLAFSVEKDVSPIPKSLHNIFKEYSLDLSLPVPPNGDLTPWVKEGVMLLNRHLTVEAGKPMSHQHYGWDQISEQALKALNDRGKPFVAILWGNEAKKLKPLIPNALIVESAHPSPLSAHRGFFGSKPFSTTNRLLEENGLEPIDWDLSHKEKS